MFKRIDHVEITTNDLDESIKFYSDVFGFKMKERLQPKSPAIEEVAFLTLGDTMLELVKMKATVPFPACAQVGFRSMAIEVDSMDRAIEFLKTKGVAITWGPVDVGGSIRAEIKDWEGLVVELRQWQ
jgi:glyoxylase I family protein